MGVTTLRVVQALDGDMGAPLHTRSSVPPEVLATFLGEGRTFIMAARCFPLRQYHISMKRDRGFSALMASPCYTNHIPLNMGRGPALEVL